jgi:hypothetical protein
MADGGRMTTRTKLAALALVAVLLGVAVVFGLFSKGPTLMWDASPGATRYEVQIDGALLGSFTETRARLPRGFVTGEHTVEVRACIDQSCSPWQTLTAR